MELKDNKGLLDPGSPEIGMNLDPQKDDNFENLTNRDSSREMKASNILETDVRRVNSSLNKSLKIPPFSGDILPPKKAVRPQVAVRSKTSLRMKYEAEIKLIINAHGDLESIRESLGLSRREICQILLVDPSAWSRWTQKNSMAPPHIYRALQWYLNLTEKHPAWHPSNSFHPKMAALTEGQINKITNELENKVKSYGPQQQALSQHMNRKFEDQIELWQTNHKELVAKAEGVQAINIMWKLLLIGVTFISALLLWKS